MHLFLTRRLSPGHQICKQKSWFTNIIGATVFMFFPRTFLVYSSRDFKEVCGTIWGDNLSPRLVVACSDCHDYLLWSTICSVDLNELASVYCVKSFLEVYEGDDTRHVLVPDSFQYSPPGQGFAQLWFCLDESHSASFSNAA